MEDANVLVAVAVESGVVVAGFGRGELAAAYCESPPDEEAQEVIHEEMMED
jgi:hypothetical protein